MIVVADTSPLNYLLQIECDELLPKLYKRVYVPPAVLRELRNAGAPGLVKDWVLRLPTWIKVHNLEAPLDSTLEFLMRANVKLFNLLRSSRLTYC